MLVNAGKILPIIRLPHILNQLPTAYRPANSPKLNSLTGMLLLDPAKAETDRIDFGNLQVPS